MVKENKIFYPIPENVEVYERLYREIYKKIYEKNKEMFKELERFSRFKPD